MALAPQVDLGLRDHLLYELARDLSSSLELDIVLRKVMDRVITLMKASRGFIVLVDPGSGTMSVQMSSGEADAEKTRSFLGSRTVIEQVVASGRLTKVDERELYAQIPVAVARFGKHLKFDQMVQLRWPVT